MKVKQRIEMSGKFVEPDTKSLFITKNHQYITNIPDSYEHEYLTSLKTKYMTLTAMDERSTGGIGFYIELCHINCEEGTVTFEISKHDGCATRFLTRLVRTTLSSYRHCMLRHIARYMATIPACTLWRIRCTTQMIPA